MRVCLVASEWDYGDPERGRSFEWHTFHETLRLDGHDVHLFDPVAAQRRLASSEVQGRLLESVRDATPDIVLCVLFKDEVLPSTLRSVRDDFRIPVVNWFCDDHWRYDTFSRQIAPVLTLSVTTSGQAAARYRQDGYPVLLSQWGYPHKAYGVPERPSPPSARFVFVGQCYGERARALSSLRTALRDAAVVETYGFGSPNGRVAAEQMIQLFSDSLGAINFSSSWRPGVLSRIRRRQWRRTPASRQLKARVFEVTGAGGLLLTEPSDDLDTYFRSGEDVVVFRSQEELIQLARRELEDPSWAEGIRRSGHERCLAEHTMSQRLAEVMTRALR